MTLRLGRALFAGCLVGAAPAGAADLEAEVLSRALAATVYVEVHRSGVVPLTTGSAFFIEPEGFALTSSALVDDEVVAPPDSPHRRVVSAVRQITLTSAPDDPQGGGWSARLVSVDDYRGIALLQITGKPPSTLEVAAGTRVAVDQEVWVFGFPGSGEDSTGVGAEPRRRPDTSVNSGRVVALRHDAHGGVRLFQLDAALNPGNGGGPVLTAEGRLVGMVLGGLSGGTRVGFAIPSTALHGHLWRNAFEVTVQPPVVHSEADELYVNIDSVVGRLENSSGSVSLELDGSEVLTTPLRPTGNFATAKIPLDDQARISERVVVEVAISQAEESRPWVRRYRIPVRRTVAADPEAAKPKVGTATASSPLGAGSFSHSQGAYDDRAAGDGGLADVARKTSLKKDPRGDVVVDGSTIRHLTDARVKAAEYERLPSHALKRLASDYDRTEIAELEAWSEYQEVETGFGLGRFTSLDRDETRRIYREADAALLELEQQVEEAGLSRNDEGVWSWCRQGDSGCVAGSIAGKKLP